ncbi:MAG: hypothetical protein IPK81_19400 [Rhodospirillales bacterium]|nr:MAG: hypothetical protein IPK81_19400 [Rhodospirillales bacterium]
MAGATLVRTTLTGVRPLGVRGEPLHHAQAQLRAVVRRRLGERAYLLLAEPQTHATGGRIDWYSEAEGPVRALVDLPADERARVAAEIDALLASIDALGAAMEAGTTHDAQLAGRSLRLAAKRPGDDHLFLVGEQPVAVCWGYDVEAAGAVLPGAFAPGAAPATLPGAMAPSAAPFGAAPVLAGGGAAAVAARPFPWLLALLAGLLAILITLGGAWLLRHFLPVPPELTATLLPVPPAPPAAPAPPDPTPGLTKALEGAMEEERRMRATLASLRDEIARKTAMCKPPAPPKPPEPPKPPPVVEKKPEPPPKPPVVAEKKPEPPPKPPEPPKPPDDRMRMPKAPTNDYSFLQGCWRTDTFKHGPRVPAGFALYCFDANGRGTMEFRFVDGTVCRAPATARYAGGGALRIVDADTTCNPRGSWAQDRLDCTPGAGGVADCRGENRTERWNVALHRVGQ